MKGSGSLVPAWCFALFVILGIIEAEAQSSKPPPKFLNITQQIIIASPHSTTRFDDANSLFIEGETGVLIIDAPIDTRVNAAWIKKARSLKKPIRWVINTHWHADHHQGNAQLKAAFPEVTIIGHSSLTEDIPNRAAKDHQERVEQIQSQIPKAQEALIKGLGLSGQELTEEQQVAQRKAIIQAKEWLREQGSVEFLAPTQTIQSKQTLDLGNGISVTIQPLPAHTRGDVWVWVPSRKLVVTGDVVDELPYVGHGTPLQWKQQLAEVLAKHDFEGWSVIPGHGNILHPSHIQTIHDYLSALITEAETAKEAGLTLEQAQAKIDLSEWKEKLAKDELAEKFFDATIADAVEAAWNDL